MRSSAALGIGAVLFSATAFACDYHLGLTPPVEAAPTPMLDWSVSLSAELPLADTVTDPAIVSWKQNLTGAKGSSPNTTINNYVSLIDADVRTVAYNTVNVYVRASGIPSHPVGPFLDGNPSVPSDRNRTFRIPRSPQVNNGTKTNTGLGAIGVMTNGVPFYNALDARSYNNQNVWHQNANVAEAAGFDTGPGHPSPIMGTSNPVQGAYHYHQKPTALINQLDPGNTGQEHSPIIGYAFDGFPIYGPYGFANADGTGGIERMDSSWQPRSITTRTHLADGTDVLDGPAVGGQFPLGYYVEDFVFQTGSGELDQFNGRFSVTPEYPDGIYAYFATINASGQAAYPYIIGPQYNGVVATDNLGGAITVPGDVTYYVAPEPGAAAVCGIFLAGGLLRRARARH